MSAETRVVLKQVSLAANVRIPDQPGDVEKEISRAITRAAAEITTLARRSRVVLSSGKPEIVIQVLVRAEGLEVPPGIDMEEVRRAAPVLKDPFRLGVIWERETSSDGAW